MLDIERLIHLVLDGDLDAASALQRQAQRRDDPTLESLASKALWGMDGLERIHRGPLFDVYRATVAGYDICLKCLSPEDLHRRNAIGRRWSHTNETNLFFGQGMGWTEDDDGACPNTAHFEALLAAEHEVISAAAVHWNHPGSSLARWDHEALLKPLHKDLAHGTLCLVMPYRSGRSLSRFARNVQRRLFPSMLPSLWRALTHCPHGDLGLDDIYLDVAGWFFRILDPGVSIPGPARDRERPFELDFESTLFTTNVARYPLLLPEHGPASPRARAPYHGLDYQLRRDALAHSLYSVSPLQPIHTTPVPSPAAPDLMALGALYFTILTRRDLIDALELVQPLWSNVWDHGLLPTPEHNPTELALELTARLEHALRISGASEAEHALCLALVTLNLDSPEHLLARVRDVLRTL